MKLILKIAAGIVLAVVILGALFVGVPALMDARLTAKAESIHLSMCERQGIPAAECKKP